MLKFVLDADAIIKLAKAGVLERLAENSKCIMPQRVYDEVMKGKDGMYEDAFITESLVKMSKLNVEGDEETEENAELESGENAALKIFKKQKADAIVSDDHKFLIRLQRNKIHFITPPNAIVWLVKDRKMTSDEGLKALEKMKQEIRKEVYERAKSLLGGK